jgi:hypothetical protein
MSPSARSIFALILKDDTIVKIVTQVSIASVTRGNFGPYCYGPGAAGEAGVDSIGILRSEVSRWRWRYLVEPKPLQWIGQYCGQPLVAKLLRHTSHENAMQSCSNRWFTTQTSRSQTAGRRPTSAACS